MILTSKEEPVTCAMEVEKSDSLFEIIRFQVIFVLHFFVSIMYVYFTGQF